MVKIQIVDPPSGWKYGFPKPMSPMIVNVREWLIDNGYPEYEFKQWDEAGQPLPYRLWWEETPIEQVPAYYWDKPDQDTKGKRKK